MPEGMKNQSVPERRSLRNDGNEDAPRYDHALAFFIFLHPGVAWIVFIRDPLGHRFQLLVHELNGLGLLVRRITIDEKEPLERLAQLGADSLPLRPVGADVATHDGDQMPSDFREHSRDLCLTADWFTATAS